MHQKQPPAKVACSTGRAWDGFVGAGVAPVADSLVKDSNEAPARIRMPVVTARTGNRLMRLSSWSKNGSAPRGSEAARKARFVQGTPWGTLCDRMLGGLG
jgi:hypothetical protein